MFRKVITLFLFTILSLSIVGQETKPGIAVLIDWQEFQHPQNKVLLEELVNEINTSKRSSFQFYDWKEKENVLDFRYTESLEDPRPVEKIIFIKPLLLINDEPDIKYQKDTTGKVTKAYFKPTFNYNYLYKIIDISTSNIELIENFKPQKEKSKEILIKSFQSVFRADPEKLKKDDPKEYKKRVKVLRDKYAKEINAFIAKSVKEAKEEISSGVSSPLKSVSDDRLFKMVKFDESQLSKKRIKEFEIDAGLVDDVTSKSSFNVYTNSTYGTQKIIEKIDRTFVKDASEKNSICKSGIFYGKKLTSALKNKQEVFFARSDILLKKLNNKVSKPQTVAVDKACMFCAFSLEQKIANSPSILLIERNYDKVLSHFIELTKADKFLDLNLESIQGKQQGVRYIISTEPGKITCTDVETGNMFEETPKTNKDGKLMKYFKSEIGFSKKMITRLFLNLFEMDIEMLQVEDSKKDKVKSVLVLNPAGFEQGERYRIYKINEEKVGDKTLERKEELGTSWVTEVKSDQIAILDILKGKKELNEAINNNHKIVFINE